VLPAPRHSVRARAEIPTLGTREGLPPRSGQAVHSENQIGQEKVGSSPKVSAVPVPSQRETS
jgi:hypothetical protein